METIEVEGKQIRKWKVGASTFLAWPEAGSRLMNWHVQMADGSIRDVIHWPENANYDDIAHVRGGNPVLFPFSARTFCEGEIGFWKAPDGIRRPMQIHGYARDGKFELTSSSEKGFLATFIPSDACREAYPYQYKFCVRYRFEELSFIVDFELKNEDEQPIPWSAGHHFYFSLPWHEELSRKDYHVNIPAKKAFRQDVDGKLVPIKDFKQDSGFDDPAISDLIHCKLKHNAVILGPKSGEEALEILVGEHTVPSPWTTVVTWTMDDDSPFYCVEPWMGPPNSPEHKQGLHFVDPGKTEVFSVKVALV
ncbi:hypothetical protein [Rubellicoccus peritrichatus]|uniref:Aldose epimerase n=1 Tax=Rubellicoccus peritrichatus TaxID=3080537 RepID=A0AAQ3L9H8_9BACT|nr:hypothetical protein [Puniceicoccus sp. CR14]WOO42104.1 hypothetical protein RZN69_03320 [Puniceicoccus sp. CR14]